MDLTKAQTGDRVRSVLKGWGTIHDKLYNHNDNDNNIFVDFDQIENLLVAYKMDGKKDTIDKHPEIVELVRPMTNIEGGKYFLSSDGNVIGCTNSPAQMQVISPDKTKKRGREFKNIKQAQVADEILTPIQRLLRFAMMYDPHFYEKELYQNNMQGNATIVWDEIDQKYIMIPYCREGMTTIPISETTAKQLVDKLNSGCIKL